MRAELLTAVEEGRLVIPFAEAVGQEIAAVSLSDRTKAEQLARFYLKVASLDNALEPTGGALGQVIAERLGERPGPHYTRLTPRQRRHVRLRLSGKARTHLDDIVAEYRKDTQTWVNNTRGFRDRARAAIHAQAQAQGEMPPKPMHLREAVAPIWPKLAPDWAWAIVESRRFLERARKAGLSDDEVLLIPGLRAAIGVLVALAVTQTLNGRNPHTGDYGDFQHVAQAACAGLPLVSHDEALRKLVDAIPDSPLEVISVEEMLRRVR